jgi:hypothetical protein
MYLGEVAFVSRMRLDRVVGDNVGDGGAGEDGSVCLDVLVEDGGVAGSWMGHSGGM